MNIDHALLDFVDNILAYLEDTLPLPLHSFLIKALSHCLALLSAAQGVFTTLLSRNPAEWDAQSILPPLITLLAAYWALLSFYRTTTWVLRTSFSLLKWGAIIASLMAATGWFRGDNVGEMIAGNANIAGQVGRFLFNQMWGTNPTSSERSESWAERTKRKNRQSSSSRQRTKPKPWESFEQHREWREQEAAQTLGVEEIINNIAAAADEVLQDNQWWSTARRFIPAFSGMGGAQADNNERRGGQPSGDRARSSRSR